MLGEGPRSPWEKLLERPHGRGHFVQLYESRESSLAENVALYISEGLKSGDGVMIIATPEHRPLFCDKVEECGVDTRALIADGQLALLDAHETLDRFMEGGQPVWSLFEQVLGSALGKVSRSEHAGLRAYGEMVGVLWKARQFAAAIRLEQFWNRLLARSSFSLYCAYAIDIFSKEFHIGNVDGVLCTHTHLVPAEPNGNLETALHLSMDEVLGSTAAETRILARANYDPSWAFLPDAEAALLWLRKNLPDQAEEIIMRARHHYGLLNAKKGDRSGCDPSPSPRLQFAD
jgi:hypothetical protein